MFKNTISLEVEVKEALTYQDIDDIGANQTYEYIGGFFPVWVELIQEKKELRGIIQGLNIDKKSIIIATKHEHNFKRGDLVRLYGHEQYKIKNVHETIDPQYANTVRMFPNSKRMYTWKVIELGD